MCTICCARQEKGNVWKLKRKYQQISQMIHTEGRILDKYFMENNFI